MNPRQPCSPGPDRVRGRVPPALLVVLGSLLVGGILLVALIGLEPERDDARGGRVVLLCAAGLRAPMEAVIEDYREECGVEVAVEYAGSGVLLSQLELRDDVDLYVAGDESFLDLAAEAGLLAERAPIARLTPTFAVARDRALELSRLDELPQASLRYALGNPTATAVGKCTRRLLEPAGLADEVFAGAAVIHATVEDLAVAVEVGGVDVAVVWDATVATHEGLRGLPIEGAEAAAQRAAVGVLRQSPQPTRALHFLRYLGAADRGLHRFEERGFAVLEGDRWAERPQLEIYCGAMLRPAVDERITAFEQREGVLVHRVYNGCGILVSQMNAGDTPDAYFSCEQSYYDMVEDRFEPGAVVSANQLVMLVQGGNPAELKAAADLCREGLKVGVANPDESALGGWTRAYLRTRGLWQSFLDSGNWLVESATGDYLVNQVRVGALDAAVVYTSNAHAVREHLDVIPLPGDDAFARQPYGVARDSEHAQLARRLHDFLRTASAREDFERLGFRWEAGAPSR